jgi:hypothetical protein
VIDQLLASAVFPALAAGAALLLPLGWHRLRGGRLVTAPFGAFGLVAAYLVCHPVVRGKLPELPPPEATDWPWFLAPLALLVALGDLRWGRVVPVRWGLRLGALAVGVLALGRLLPGFFGGSAGWLTACLAWGVGILLLAGLDALARRPAQPPSLLLLVVLLGGASGVMLAANSAVLGQLCGVLAAALGAQLVLSWWQPALTPLAGTAPALGLILANLLFAAHLFGYPELPPASAALLALAPALAWGCGRGPAARLAPWQGLCLGLVAVTAASGAAAWLAHAPAPEPYMPY